MPNRTTKLTIIASTMIPVITYATTWIVSSTIRRRRKFAGLRVKSVARTAQDYNGLTSEAEISDESQRFVHEAEQLLLDNETREQAEQMTDGTKTELVGD